MASAPPQAHNLQPPPLSRDGKRWTRRRRGTRGLVVDLRAVPNVNHNDDNTRVHNVSKPDLLAVNALPRNLGSFKGANLPQKLTHPPADSTAQFQLPATNLSSLLQAIHILQIRQMCTQRFPKIKRTLKRTRPPRTSRQLIQTPLLLVIDTQARITGSPQPLKQPTNQPQK